MTFGNNYINTVQNNNGFFVLVINIIEIEYWYNSFNIK